MCVCICVCVLSSCIFATKSVSIVFISGNDYIEYSLLLEVNFHAPHKWYKNEIIAHTCQMILSYQKNFEKFYLTQED